MLRRNAAFLLVLFATAPFAIATVSVVDPNYGLFVRTNAVQGFPLAVDPVGNLYTVTGTSIDDSLVKIAPNGIATTLNSSVGNVVGVFADLKFGFGGNLYANCGVGGYPSPQGVVQFNSTTGAASSFYTYPSGYADGGLAFNASTQTLYLTSEEDHALTALSSTAQNSQVLPGVTEDAAGMDIESNGDVLVMDRTTGDVIQVNPTTQTQQTLVELSQLLPNETFTKIAVDPTTNDIFFDSNLNGESFLYRLNPDGSAPTEIATDVNSVTGFDGLAIGASGDGSGQASIYLTDPGTDQIVELRSVPEPASLSILLGMTMGLLARRRTRYFA